MAGRGGWSGLGLGLGLGVALVLAWASPPAAQSQPVEIRPLEGSPAAPPPFAPRPLPPMTDRAPERGPDRGSAPQRMVPPGANEGAILGTPENILAGSGEGQRPRRAAGEAQIEGDGRLILTPAFCRQLTEHVAAPDVNLTPSGSASAALPARIRTDLIIDTASRARLPAIAGLRGETMVGALEVDPRTGETLFNGQPLGDIRARQLAEACARLR